ncbi:MAG: polyhydroxyalkanoate synthesis regulator DNA-binding domain-containing protein [Deltaproteobacteria bacterium]|nr:polyhydroxyalkanoate synthesis regulator DNA-binding domain-containing protein [Deltaproteobacteria bacterium]
MEQPSEPREQRTIRRYANRKLYDTTESRYVTLQDVETLVRRGVEVRVIDNRTGEDVTQTALAQILCDAGRRGDPRYSLGTLLALFRRPELEVRVRELFRRRGDGGKAESAAEPAAAGSESAAEPEPVRHEMLASLVRRAEEVQRRIDELVNQIVSDFEPLKRIGAEVRALDERLTALEKRVARKAPARRRRRRAPGAGAGR